MIQKFKTKAEEVEVIRWIGNNVQEVEQFTEQGTLPSFAGGLYVRRKTSDMFVANLGDYIIKSANGGFSICEASIFKKKYEPSINP